MEIIEIVFEEKGNPNNKGIMPLRDMKIGTELLELILLQRKEFNRDYHFITTYTRGK